MIKKIAFLMLVSLILFSPNLFAEKEREVNPWRELFTEPCEIVYFIMKDGQPFRVSDGGVRRIHVPIEELKKRLKEEKEAYEIKDIAIVIHNHRFKRKFSPADWKFYRDLKTRGFNGQFLMYCHITNKVYDIEDNKKGGKNGH